MSTVCILRTAQGQRVADARIIGSWAVHLTDDIAKERYSVSHVTEGRWVVQNLTLDRAIKLAQALDTEYRDVDGKDNNQNIEIMSFCSGFIAPSGALRRTLSRRAKRP